MSVLGNIGRGALTLLGGGPLLAIPNIREAERMKLDAKRMELSDAKRQREALAELKGLLGENTTIQAPSSETQLESVSGPATPITIPGQKARVPMLSTGQGQQQALGLLADAAPNEFAGILGRQLFPEPRQQGRLTEKIGMFRQLMGRDPNEEEARTLLDMDEGGSLQDDKTRLEIAKLMRELQSEVDEESEAEAAKTRSIQSRLARADKILGLTQSLEGSSLEPGKFAVEARRPFVSLAGEVGGLFGAEEFAQARQQEATAFDVLQKETSIFINEMMSQLSDQGDRTTDAKLRQLQNSAATVTESPGAIRSIMSEAIRTSLEEADRLGVKLEGRRQYQRLLRELDDRNPGGADFKYNPVTGELEAVNAGR